jgi:hypothetical protein
MLATKTPIDVFGIASIHLSCAIRTNPIVKCRFIRLNFCGVGSANQFIILLLVREPLASNEY